MKRSETVHFGDTVVHLNEELKLKPSHIESPLASGRKMYNVGNHALQSCS